MKGQMVRELQVKLDDGEIKDLIHILKTVNIVPLKGTENETLNNMLDVLNGNL